MTTKTMNQKQAIELIEKLYNSLETKEINGEDYAISIQDNSLLLVCDAGRRVYDVHLFYLGVINFKEMLRIAAWLIEEEPDEIICIDTDTDAYQVDISCDFFHRYDLQDVIPKHIYDILCGIEELNWLTKPGKLDDYTSWIKVINTDYHS